MSVYSIEGDVYWGNTTTPITHLSGGSGRGISVANVPARRVMLAVQTRRRLARVGLDEDHVEGLNLGHGVARVTLSPRDVDPTTLRLIARELMSDSDTLIRSSGGNVHARLKTAKTMQFLVVTLSTSEHSLYLPAATLAPGQDLAWVWGRDLAHSDVQELVLVASRPQAQSTPAYTKGTAANIASIYSLTA